MTILFYLNQSPDETPADDTRAEITASVVLQESVAKVHVYFFFKSFKWNIRSFLIVMCSTLSTPEIQFSELQASLSEDIKKSVASVPFKTETKPENDTSSAAKNACPVSATDPAVQLNIPTKITGNESMHTKQVGVMQEPEGVMQNDALNPEHTEAFTLKPGLVCKDKDIEDIGTESDLQEMLEESKSKAIEKEMVRQSGFSEEQQRAVSFLPTLDTNRTTSQEITSTVQYYA